jgi:hypothetical protein
MVMWCWKNNPRKSKNLGPVQTGAAVAGGGEQRLRSFAASRRIFDINYFFFSSTALASVAPKTSLPQYLTTTLRLQNCSILIFTPTLAL